MTAPLSADPEALRAHVRALVEDFAPRDCDDPQSLRRAANYIRRHFQTAGGRVSEQTWTIDGREYVNVFARFGPSEGPPVVVGAHYDAYGGLPGADDNASGTAGLLVLADKLGRSTPAVPIELAAYSLEEPPYFRTELMGSAHHAARLKAEGVAVRLMVCLEMIGYFTDAPKSQGYPLSLLKLFYPRRGNFVALVGSFGQSEGMAAFARAMARATDLPVQRLLAPASLTGVDFSDHRNFWKQGFPAFMVTDTAFYRNKRYHTAEDLPETLDYRRMSQVVCGVYAALSALPPVPLRKKSG